MSHEILYQYMYADKAQCVDLWRSFRCQKKKRNRYASGRERRGHIPNRRSNQERPARLKPAERLVTGKEAPSSDGHQEAIVSMIERKRGLAVLAKVEHKTGAAVSQAIIDRLKPFATRVAALTYDNGKEFAYHARLDAELGQADTSVIHLPAGSVEPMKTQMT